MSVRYTPSHIARKDAHARLITSQEARDVGMSHPDPLIREMYQLAVPDSSLAGFKHMVPRYSDKRFNPDGSPVQLPGYDLVSDDPLTMSDLERVEMQLAEMAAAKEGSQVESAPRLSAANQAILLNAIRNEVSPGAIRVVGGLGVDGRRYPEGHPLAGRSIPTKDILSPVERAMRADKIFVDVAGMEAPVGGAQLTGNALDAMHKHPLAESILSGNPKQIAEKENIYIGPNSLNQSDGSRIGEELRGSRTSRLHRLLGEAHTLETGSPVTRNADEYSRSDDSLLKELGVEALIRDHQYRRQLEREAGKIINELAGARIGKLPEVVSDPIVARSRVAKESAKPAYSVGRDDITGDDKQIIIAQPGAKIYTNGRKNGGH